MAVEISDKDLLVIFRNFLKAGKVRFKSGSYNRADPTFYEKAEFWMVFENGDPIDQTQEPAVYRTQYHDCTWGVTIRVQRYPERIPILSLIDSYLDRQEGKWVRHEHGNEVEVRHFLLACMGDGEIRTTKPDLEAEYEADSMARESESRMGWDASP